jgi:hypothetical protein
MLMERSLCARSWKAPLADNQLKKKEEGVEGEGVERERRRERKRDRLFVGSVFVFFDRR